MEIVTVIREYLAVLLSAPPLLTMVILIGIYRFSDDIKDLLLRVARIRLPGGAEFATQQSRRIIDETPTAPPNTEEIPVQGIPPDLAPAHRRKIANLVRSHIATAYLWEYRYLNYFLARTTQFALGWLVGLAEPTTYSHYDSSFLLMVSSARERQAMIGALETHHLIKCDDRTQTICVTPKGREYHEWRGTLPPVRNASTGPT